LIVVKELGKTMFVIVSSLSYSSSGISVVASGIINVFETQS
jgi:hypothetical protein